MWRPGDDVDRGGVKRKVEDASPLRAAFAPDEDLAIVACTGEDVAVFWVSPGYTPDCAFVSMEG